MRTERPHNPDVPQQLERRMQVRGLVYLALAALAFTVLRATVHGGWHSVFPRGWWHVW